MVTQHEQFAVIPSAPCYEISTSGKVRRVDNHRPLTASPCTRNKYLGVCLSSGLPSKQTRYVHRLVVEAHGNLPAGMIVHHVNSCRVDARLDNLEVCTQQENMRRSHEDGCAFVLRNEANPAAWKGSLTHCQVWALRRARDGKRGAVAQLARDYDVSTSVASAAARRATYRWLGETALESLITREEAIAARDLRRAMKKAERAIAARRANPGSSK